jgi:2-dehydro-3-deoxyphosphogluconate aldolase/(4S)-4-hydroxy-2-oxoglutarate aldolase
MGRIETFARVRHEGIIPAIRTSEPAEAVHAALAIQLGGIMVVEVSRAPAGSLAVLSAVAKAHGRHMLIGAGSIVNADGVAMAAQAGAQFVVTPGYSAEAVKKAAELDLAIFVGAITPTEVQMASASGADAVKLFPCFAMAGPRYLKALRGQYPQTPFIASGGVTLENCSDYIRAGAIALGIGGDIADAESMAAGDHRVFTVRAKRFREAMAAARAFEDAARSINVGEAK